MVRSQPPSSSIIAKPAPKRRLRPRRRVSAQGQSKVQDELRAWARRMQEQARRRLLDERPPNSRQRPLLPPKS